ncbi:hypothetical protein BS50DRAFT_196872 [Corynespora cassiicola Philippines]|uniref:Peptidase S33 tripeptidyl aminopeptidase-like C-terminal domain-containing protein n=1 Tax=Corynespora cassiicola Philippines TaxID=1448308 RepID=A0A2T2N5J3_CORCC|nr:hypothetical protein BS50DRAFT_196872 [Corynespora cassiicola Philippines]
MYTPQWSFRHLALGLEAAEASNTRILDFALNALESEAVGYERDDSSEAFLLIRCIDSSRSFPIRTLNDWIEERETYRRESYYGADIMAVAWMLSCTGFNIVPPASQLFLGFNTSGTHTSTPILFRNSLRDVIAPISSAHRMSALFPGSAVLAQNSTGHGITSISNCTSQHTWAYMANATLPPPDTLCQQDVLSYGVPYRE